MVDKIWYNMEELIGGSEERVLIETYWNVKIEEEKRRRNLPRRINRNILECKEWIHMSRSHNQPRINRNILECKDGWLCDHILIIIRINRNILECKVN